MVAGTFRIAGAGSMLADIALFDICKRWMRIRFASEPGATLAE